MDYHLTSKGLDVFNNRIYVLDSSDLNKVILRDFHAKPCLGHPGYQKTLTTIKKFYYSPNLKMDVA